LDPGDGRMRPGADAIRHVEESVAKFGGASLRYGWLYGPGALDDTVAVVRKRQFRSSVEARGTRRGCTSMTRPAPRYWL
jgi:hypothetical protein